MKNVYYQFLTANINLFLNAYIHRNYEELHKSFYSVSLSITTLDVAKTYVLPFILYWYKLWSLTATCCCCFKANWYKYKKEKRDEARNKLKKVQIYPEHKKEPQDNIEFDFIKGKDDSGYKEYYEQTSDKNIRLAL